MTSSARLASTQNGLELYATNYWDRTLGWLRSNFLIGLAIGLGVGLGAGSLAGCGGNGDAGGAPATGGRPDHRGGARGGGNPETEAAGVPVEVARPERRTISSFLETNGTLEAENDVQIVSRTSGPVVELLVEEGMVVKTGQLLARIDDTELKVQVEISEVALEQARRAHERAKASHENQIISQEIYDQALTQLESAEAQLERDEILLEYTRIVAPFDGILIERFIKFAENVTANKALFRLSDFDPLLCLIQVPEKELSGLKVGQPAHITVEAWPEERFEARVLRVSPVVDGATGTIKVTLQVAGQGKLSPGMFASVYLVRDSHSDALVIPRSALSLESLVDTVYVVDGNLAARREIELGYEESALVEVLSGLREEDRVVVVGQDGLSDGTPVYVLGDPESKRPERADEGSGERAPEEAALGAGGNRPPRDGPRGQGGGRMDPSQMTPEQLEQLKDRMRQRGMSDEQIDKILQERMGNRQR